MFEAKHITRPTQYASCGDFFRIFYKEIDSHRQLSLLLTADREKPELCFVCGL